MNRDDLRLFFTSGLEALAWGEAAEMANAGLVAECDRLRGEAEDDKHTITIQANTIAEKDATIAAKDGEIFTLTQFNGELADAVNERDAEIADLTADVAAAEALITQHWDTIERLKAELALYKPTFILGDATRKQFLGAPFTEPFTICYESAFYPSGVDRTANPISFDYVLNHTMPDWRGFYPNSPRWIADIEWANSGGRTSDEAAKILPAFQAARQFAEQEGKGLKIGGYDFPRRFGTHMSDDEVMAQAAIDRPILDLLDECILTLYPIYTDIERSRTYIRRNIEMGRRILPGKPVYVLLAPGWHPTVGAPLANTPISVEWWRMAMDECRANADGFAIWLKASAPKPTNEPWWLETLAWSAA